MNRTWFPLLKDEIAEPRPDMNIKVATFTVSEKFINTYRIWPSKSSHVIIQFSIVLHWLLKLLV